MNLIIDNHQHHLPCPNENMDKDIENMDMDIEKDMNADIVKPINQDIDSDFECGNDQGSWMFPWF